MQVFVSYRRLDNPLLAEQVRAAIDERFGEGSAFLDRVNIGAGADYRHELEEAIHNADCLLALIGPNWRADRLADPDDPVEFELRLAKQSGSVVIPVLHTEERMPPRTALPSHLRWFADINAFEFISPQNFSKEVEQLLTLMASLVASRPASVRTERPKAVDEETRGVAHEEALESQAGPVPPDRTPSGLHQQGTPILNDRYEIQQRIGRGGMADVFLARDRLLDRPVAIKVLFPEYALDPNFVERFRGEAQTAANLTHPNIVGVYDWGRYDNTYFMAMEYVQGRTLADILRANRSVTSQQAAEIAIEVTGALKCAHRSGVVHRDIKPTNILIGVDGAVKVGDFGGAFAMNATYFSPEQAQGAQPDPRSDLYSLGVVLYEMVGGRPPFTGENPVSIAYKQVHENPEPLNRLVADVSKGFEAIVAKSLAKRPELRYQSADEVRDELLRFRNGEPVQALVALMSSATDVVRVEVGTIARPDPKVKQGNLAKKAQELRSILANQTHTYGTDHPYILYIRHRLGQTLAEAGEFHEALTTLRSVLDDQGRINGTDHHDTIHTRLEIGDLLGRLGDPEGAVLALQIALTDLHRTRGMNDPEALETRLAIAYWLLEAGHRRMATERLRRLLYEQRRNLGSDHPRVKELQNLLNEVIHESTHEE